MSKPRQERVPEIDLLRAASICVIVAMHARGYVYPDGRPPGVLSSLLTRDMALGILFFISGAGIALSRADLSVRGATVRFLRRRLLRVYPMYLVAIAIFAAIGTRQLTATPIAFAAHALLVETWVYPLAGEVVKTLWFVSVIVLYYLAYVWFMRARDPLRIVTRMAIVGIAFVVLHFAFGLSDYRVLAYYPVFVAGCAMGRWRRSLEYLDWRAAVGALALTPLALMLDGSPAEGSALQLWAAMFTALLGPPLFWWAATLLVRLDAVRVWAGTAASASYGMYLFHRPVLTVMRFGWNVQTLWGKWAWYWGFGLVVAFFVGLSADRIGQLLLSRLRWRDGAGGGRTAAGEDPERRSA